MRNRLDIVASAGPRAGGAVLATVPSGLEIFPEGTVPEGLARRERKFRPPARVGSFSREGQQNDSATDEGDSRQMNKCYRLIV
jgi:hypothetical protein